MNVYNALLWRDAPSDAVSLKMGRPLPMAYNQHFSQDNTDFWHIRQRFIAWLETEIHSDYDGPVCLDWELPHTYDLAPATIEPRRLRDIQKAYVEALAVAAQHRPAASFGFWGLPMRRHTLDAWREQGHNLHGIVSCSDVLFPHCYWPAPTRDYRPVWVEYIQRTAEAKNHAQVIVFVGLRYYGRHQWRHRLVTDEEFTQPIEAAIDAGANGIAVWDAQSIHRNAPDQSEPLDSIWSHYMELALDFVRSSTSGRYSLMVP